MERNVKGEYKFRVSCKLRYNEIHSMREFEFQYPSLEQARKNYKIILLGLYKNKRVLTFSICLNRVRDKKWINAIFNEKVLNR